MQGYISSGGRWKLALLAMLVCGAGQARADVMGQLWENQSTAAGNATIANQPAGAPDAKFSTTGINFDSNVGGYTEGGFLNNPVFTNTSAGFNPTDGLNNTYFLFTGKTFLFAGNNTFVVGHDDGLELNFPALNGGMDVIDQPGPTPFTNTPFTVNAPSDGLYDFTMSYGECCGPPAELLFQINGTPVGSPAAPLPSSMYGGMLLLAGLALLKLARGRFTQSV